MLTRGDEYPLHQTAEPIAYAGTDRNFYDRAWFGGYAPDGSTVFQFTLGVYPHLDIADAHFAVLGPDGVQRCLHGSRWLGMERMDLTVGPMRIEVLEELSRLRVVVDDHAGLGADLTFEGRAFPIQEPRATWRIGPRTYLDYTRFTQNGHWSGWIEVDGERTEIAPGTPGTRDRSWGVRPIGERDRQPFAPPHPPQFFWVWTPVNLAGRSVFFHRQADAAGGVLGSRAVLCPDGAGPDAWTEIADAEETLRFRAGTRWPEAASVRIRPPGEPELTLEFEPLARFHMQGIGYGHPAWGPGRHHGELVLEREDVVPADVDPAAASELHVHTIARVAAAQDGVTETGVGTLETIVIGPYAPYGFADVTGPAREG